MFLGSGWERILDVEGAVVMMDLLNECCLK